MSDHSPQLTLAAPGASPESGSSPSSGYLGPGAEARHDAAGVGALRDADKTPQALHIRFTLDEAEGASEEWRFNCGPSALCAALKMRPEEIRPHMCDFEEKGYTNPTLMFEVLKRLDVPHQQIYRSDRPDGIIPDVRHGLMRVQWGGPWTKPGVPMRVRYRKTHWVALANHSEVVFDVNAMCVGGWLGYNEWFLKLVPWLIRECEPKADGTWWPTHVIAIRSDADFGVTALTLPSTQPRHRTQITKKLCHRYRFNKTHERTPRSYAKKRNSNTRKTTSRNSHTYARGGSQSIAAGIGW